MGNIPFNGDLEAEVVWFNPQKLYGFARLPDGTEIFFHFNDGRWVTVENHQAFFTKPTHDFMGKAYRLPYPVEGDVIILIKAKGQGGKSKASPWTFRYLLCEAWTVYDTLEHVCSCGHKERDHAGGYCTVQGCWCGDEDLQRAMEEEVASRQSVRQFPSVHLK